MVDVPFAAVVLLDDQPTVAELSGGDGATSAGLAAAAAAIAAGARDASVAAAEVSVAAADDATEEAGAAHDDRLAADLDAASAAASLAGVLAAVDGVSLTSVTLNAVSRTLLAALDYTLGLAAWLDEGFRSGLFTPVVGDLSAEVTADPEQGEYVAFDSDPTGGDGAWKRVATGNWTPEMYGAFGDGSNNDTDAFQALSAKIEALGGGRIDLRAGAVYKVGQQTFQNNGTFMWVGQHVLRFDGLTNPLTIFGNGAKFVLDPTLKWGSFNSSGIATSPGSAGQDCSPLEIAVVAITDCTSRIHLQDFEVDGNKGALNLGGAGGFAYQLGGDGIFLQNNSAGVTIINCPCHHCPRDGHDFRGVDGTDLSSPKEGSLVIGSHCEWNARQGMSFTGGRGWKFTGCRYNHNGKGDGPEVSPACGVDLEIETGLILDIDFDQCEFIDNAGLGFLPAGGVVSYINLYECKLVGTTAAAGWAYQGYNVNFDRCIIAGSLLVIGHPFSLPQSSNNHFKRCLFTDDPTITSVGTLSGGPLDALGSNAADIIFERCHFRVGYTKNMSLAQADLRDCTFDIGSAVSTGFTTSNHISGLTEILAAVGSTAGFLSSSGGVRPRLGSNIKLNGTHVRRATATWDPASVANGARTTTTISVPWARFTDQVRVTFSNSLQGLRLFGYVSTDAGTTALTAAGVVTVVLENNTGGTVDLASGTLIVSVIDPDLG